MAKYDLRTLKDKVIVNIELDAAGELRDRIADSAAGAAVQQALKAVRESFTRVVETASDTVTGVQGALGDRASDVQEAASDMAEKVTDMLPDFSRVPEPRQWLAGRKAVRYAVYIHVPTTKARQLVSEAVQEIFRDGGGGLLSPSLDRRNNGRTARWIYTRGHYAHREFELYVEVEPVIFTRSKADGSNKRTVRESRVTVTALARDHRLSGKEKAVLTGEFAGRIEARARGVEFEKRNIPLLSTPLGEGLSLR